MPSLVWGIVLIVFVLLNSVSRLQVYSERIQNKMHYVVHGRTAAELIVDRADAAKEHMGE